MESGKSSVKRLLRNVAREGWSNKKIDDFVDSVWRDHVDLPNEVIYGYLTWEGGLNFKGSIASYRINNTKYKAPAKNLPCAAADPLLPRTDLAVLKTTREWEILTGIPSENPMPRSDYDRNTTLAVVPIDIPAAATQPANMVEGQIYNEHIAGEWTPSIVGTTADFDSTAGPSIGAKCAAIGALTNGNMIVFTALADHKDTDWSTLSFDLQLPNTNSKSNFIEAYFTRNGRACSKLVPATFSRLNLNWQKVVFAIPDFAVRNSTFNGLVLRWSNSGGTYAGIKIDNVRLQKGIELPATIDNYSTGIDWDEATQTLTIHRTGSLGPLVKQLTGIGGGGDDGKSAYEIAVLNGFEGTEAEWLASLVGDDGTSSYTYVAYASDNAGTGFSLTPTDLLKYRAEIHRTSTLSPPTSSDFAGATWVKYIGDDGADGTGGGGSDVPELHLDFGETGLAYTYNVPYDMKFTSQVSENGNATLSIALNTYMSRYTKLTITATAAGLVSLYGEYV